MLQWKDMIIHILALWSWHRTHALFLVVGLVEIFLVKRWCWKRGLVWVIVLQALRKSHGEDSSSSVKEPALSASRKRKMRKCL